ncbi:MAG TPA: universal stress protein [Candidatus Anammoximicrobium sp.]|nr:universal stress protein [Candidatus Anammoximicrobium sp.]
MSWFPKRTVVVPVDFSDDSLAAVDTALELVADPSGVQVVHVLPEASMMDPDPVWLEIDNANRSERTIDALRQRLPGERYEKLPIEIEFGDPGYRIADFAQRIGAELIVIPSHGRTGLGRMLLGSVTERVIRLSHCPVLVLRK